MANDLAVIGTKGKDKQTNAIVTGKMDYSADVLAGKKLFTRILGSPYAHAKINSINTSAAEALDGVEAVCTYKDCPVFSDELRYWGQEVAAVAATDPNIAAQAIELIDVDYDELPFVLDPDEAMKPGAPLVGTLPESNMFDPYEVVRGDTQAGWAEATYTLEEDVGWTTWFQHGSPEPRSTVAYWLGDQLYFWATSQNPFSQRAQAAGYLQLPLNRVHAISHGTGHASGDKHWAEWIVVAAVLAKKAGKPVEFHLSRKENFLNATHQFSMKGNIKIGCKDDGTIVAIEGVYYADVGSSPFNLGSDALSAITQTYKCPNLKVTKTTVVTNKPKSGYFRSVGEPSGCFMFEIAIDKMAEEVGMDPYTFRMKNVFTRDLPHPDHALPYSSMAMKECFEAAANDIGFTTKWHQPNTSMLDDGRMHGIGISGHVCDKGAHSSPVGAIINVNKDATALLSVGISRAAGGTNSAMCYIVAETLGLPYEAVNTGDWGNTDVCSEGGSQGGSTRTTTLGAAFQVAAEDAKDQMFTTAADMLGVPKADLDAKDGKIFDKNDDSNFKTHSEVLAKMAPVIGRGVGWTTQLRLSEEAGFPIGNACVVKTMIASAAEVAVDTETGEVEVLNYVAADDMGRAINWYGTEAQILGGNEICHGEALMNEQLFDGTTGACLNPNYIHQKYPTSLDIHTDKHKAIIIESIDSCGPYGAKGLGEPPVGVYGTINNAVYNAIGEWIMTSPIYPQKILKALGKA